MVSHAPPLYLLGLLRRDLRRCGHAGHSSTNFLDAIRAAPSRPTFRCRIPLIVVSPHSKGGHGGAHGSDHVSILKFIERNCRLDPLTGRSRDNLPNREQQFLVSTVNAIMGSRFWGTTAIIVMYDDSDGWYDHQMGPIVNPSAATNSNASDEDQFDAAGKCGNGPSADGSGKAIEGRCGYDPRLPLLAMSPRAKENFVDHTVIGQTSAIRFIKDDWNTGRLGNGSYDQLAGRIDNVFDFDLDDHFGRDDDGPRTLFLDTQRGQPTAH